MWLCERTQLIWLFHVTNTTDMDFFTWPTQLIWIFSCDQHNWYGYLSSMLHFSHSHMLLLEVKVQYAINIYSATKQESKIGLKSLLVTKMATTVIFKIIIFPYIANREAIYVWGSFHAFFTDFGQKWHFLRNGKEWRLHVWDLVTSVQVLSAHQVDFLNRN